MNLNRSTLAKTQFTYIKKRKSVKFVFFNLIISLIAELLFMTTKFVGRQVTRIIRPTVGRWTFGRGDTSLLITIGHFGVFTDLSRISIQNRNIF
jgi:hypothetical protein